MSKTDISGKSLDFKAYSHTPERVDVEKSAVHNKTRLFPEMSKTDISGESLDFKAYSAKSLSFHTDPDFSLPLYNVWTFAKKYDFPQKCPF